ncbi:hypothetical protein ACFQZ4_24245 [Catellatospora coxensis]
MSRQTRLQLPREVEITPAAALLPYAIVPCCTVVALPVTLLAHHAWADKPWAAVGLTVAGASVTGYTWLAGRPRGQMVRVTATVVAGAVSVWTLGATIGGPLTHPWGTCGRSAALPCRRSRSSTGSCAAAATRCSAAASENWGSTSARSRTPRWAGRRRPALESWPPSRPRRARRSARLPPPGRRSSRRST